MKLTGDKCRCMACGEYFTTTRNFDKHRKGKYPLRACTPPAAAGLVRQPSGFWSGPGPLEFTTAVRRSSGDRS